MPVNDREVVQKASRGRPRKPESEKKKYVPTGGQKGRPRIHPLKQKSDRGRGRPRVNPPKEKSGRPRGRPSSASVDAEKTPAKSTERKPTGGKRGRPANKNKTPAKKQKV